MVLELIGKSQWPRIVKTLLKKGVQGLALADAKNYSKATAFKMMWCWQNNGQIDQRDRTENVEADKARVEHCDKAGATGYPYGTHGYP